MKNLVDFYIRYYRVILVLGFVSTAIAGWIASGLTLDADLERLLPETAPSVQGLREAEKSYGVVGRVSIVLGGEKSLVEKSIKELSEKLVKISSIRRSETRRPVKFFKNRRLLYMDMPDLKTLSERVKKRLKWEKQRANPFFVDLGGKKKPEVKTEDIEKKYTEMNTEERYCNDFKNECVFFLFPNFSSGDLTKSRKLNAEIAVQLKKYVAAHPGLKAGMTGRYKKRIDQTDALIGDLLFGTALAIFLLLVFLLLYFRGFITAMVVFLPLLVGTLWSFAYARLAFGSLNILTGFFGAVLLGLGIDYGIHLVSRYLAVRDSSDLRTALIETLSSAGRASLYSGMTTIVAFGSLMVSEFVAFYEYGAIALGGIALIIFANMTILPCLLIAISNVNINLKPTLSTILAQPFIGVYQWIKQNQLILLVVFAMTVLVAGYGLTRVEFEHDFREIQTTDLESWRLDDKVDAILKLTQVPAIFLVKNAEEAEQVVKVLTARKKEMKEGWTIEKIVTAKTLLPKKQKEKFKIITDLDKKFNALPKGVIKGEVASFRDEIRRLVDHGEIIFSDLPKSLRAPLSRRTQDGEVVVVFTTISHHDSEQMAALAKVIRNVEVGNEKEIDGINDALLLVDIMSAVEKDSLFMFGLTMLGLIFVAIIAFRKPKEIVFLLITIGFAILFAFGAAGLFHIRFNFINMLVIPIWIGLGVDAGFHLMVRAEDAPEDTEGFLATAFAVSAAFITSMIGFGSMLITNHGGLFSMGLIATVGLGMIFVVSFFVQIMAFKGK